MEVVRAALLRRQPNLHLLQHPEINALAWEACIIVPRRPARVAAAANEVEDEALRARVAAKAIADGLATRRAASDRGGSSR